MPRGFDIVNSLLGILTDSKTDSYMLQCNNGIRDLLSVIQPLNLIYIKRSDAILQMAFTAIHFRKRLLANWLHLSPSSKGLHASCHTFPIPHCEVSTGWQVSIDAFQSCDNWTIKISKRHPACGRVFPEKGLPIPWHQISL